MAWRSLVAVGMAMAAGGCTAGGEESYAFPEGLEPLEESRASWPADQAEVLSVEAGQDEGESHAWAHGRGYVHADVEDVYPCLREDMVNVDRRAVSSWEVVAGVEEGYEHSYRIDNLVEDIIDVTFSDTWRHGSTQDDAGEVVFLNSRWQMTEVSCCITRKEGSIVTTPEGEGVTGVELVGHLEALQGDDAQTMASYLQDLHSSLLACVHGTEYPAFE